MKKLYAFLPLLFPVISLAGVPLFETDEVLELTLQSNFPDVNRPGAPQDVPTSAKLTYRDNNRNVMMSVEISSRGGGRSHWCKFTPLKLVLGDEAKTQNTIFNGIMGKSLKTVTHCKNTDYNKDSDWNDLVLTEHALYQILFAAGLPALDTRLAKAKYLRQNGEPFDNGYLLILENPGAFAARYGFEAIKKGKLPDNINPSTRVAFELALKLNMSEDDHGYLRAQNSVFFKTQNGGVVQVPYDFVLSPDYFPYTKNPKVFPMGFVAQYAQSHPDLAVEINYWLGVILKNRQNILQAIENVPFKQDSFQKKHLIKWVNAFFADAETFLNQKR